MNQVPEKKFPYFGIGTYGTDYNGYMFGERPINDLTYYSWDANASMSKLWAATRSSSARPTARSGPRTSTRASPADGTSSTASSRAPIR